MASPALAQIMADLAAQKPDHLAITGDLVNLGLEGEVANARAWLDSCGEPANVSVVPGNHDAYVPGALARACKSWTPFMTGDAAPKSSAPADLFPYLRLRDQVAVIGVSSAIATSPFLARGAFRSVQARRLSQILAECGRRGLFRVILIHHPPVRGAAALHKRLFGIGLFQKTVAHAWRGTRPAWPHASADGEFHQWQGRQRAGRGRVFHQSDSGRSHASGWLQSL